MSDMDHRTSEAPEQRSGHPGILGAVSALVIALALAGCDGAQTPEEVNANLPSGCKFYDLGRYKGDRIYAVRCNASVTSTNWHWRVGKTGTRYAITTWE